CWLLSDLNIFFCCLLIVGDFDYFKFGMATSIFAFHSTMAARFAIAVNIINVTYAPHAVMYVYRKTAGNY
ncbi:MAG TPA: hypothetical protein VIH86_10915, partial [Puia sp.]